MYKHLSREERYQIHSLLRANHTISEIARLLGRSRSTISRELSRGRGQRGYRAEQACRKAAQRAQRSRNARRVSAQVWADVVFYLGLQWSPEQIAQKVAVSHESVYLRVYADKAAGGNLHKNLRSQKPSRLLKYSPSSHPVWRLCRTIEAPQRPDRRARHARSRHLHREPVHHAPPR